MNSKRKLVMPTPEEDAAIARGIAADSDAVEPTTEQMQRMRPASEVLPEILGKDRAAALLKRRGRPAMALAERKVATNVRLDPDVLAAFKATGEGWQTRMNDALREYAASHKLLAA